MDRVIPTSSGEKGHLVLKLGLGQESWTTTDPKQPTIESFGVEEQIKQAVAELGQAQS